MSVPQALIVAGITISIIAHGTAIAGTLSGKISYPSDFIPADMRVCVETIDRALVKCVRAVKSYALILPAGSYFVYAKTSDRPNYKAYYTQSVICGRGMGGVQNCNSHKHILVEVTDASKHQNINSQDWYE